MAKNVFFDAATGKASPDTLGIYRTLFDAYVCAYPVDFHTGVDGTDGKGNLRKRMDRAVNDDGTLKRTRNDADEWPQANPDEKDENDANKQAAWKGWWHPADNACDYKCQLAVYFMAAIESKIGESAKRKDKLLTKADNYYWNNEMALKEENKGVGVWPVFNADHFWNTEGTEKHWFHENAVNDDTKTWHTAPQTVYRGDNPRNANTGWVQPADVAVHSDFTGARCNSFPEPAPLIGI